MAPATKIRSRNRERILIHLKTEKCKDLTEERNDRIEKLCEEIAAGSIGIGMLLCATVRAYTIFIAVACRDLFGGSFPAERTGTK